MARIDPHMKPVAPRRVLMIAYPGAHNLEVVGPLEILATTACFAGDGANPYLIAIVAENAGPVAASSGLTITATLSFEDVPADERAIGALMIADLPLKGGPP